jgi:DNA-binding MarR family transcriptional regulator
MPARIKDDPRTPGGTAAASSSSKSNGAHGPPASRLFANLEQEVFFNLQRCADLLMRDLEHLLRPHRISATQHNVLRILRASRGKGLACHEITDRMATHDPDMTRLLDRLEKRRLLARGREKGDRRVIRVRISSEGLGLLRSLDDAVRASHKRHLGPLGERRLRLLNRLLGMALRISTSDD